MNAATEKANYAIRDRGGKVAFYVFLWKRKGISLELFDDYWRNVHGPLCARLPGQHQYWQFHLANNHNGSLWPRVSGIDYTYQPEDQCDGIAELTFETESDRQAFFQSSDPLIADEHNLFNKAVGYNTNYGNSQTFIDGIPTGEPNGKVDGLKFHVMVKKADDVNLAAFCQHLTGYFTPTILQSDAVLKFRLHLFDEIDNSRPNITGVSHLEPLEKQYQAAF
ncbi:EthD domain-containing protein [Nostoc sp.]|uniref:EthD domain-containing protein n=1 Tax=Nostoc sp. TaxID=1180 RepID=UPI002FF5DFBC